MKSFTLTALFVGSIAVTFPVGSQAQTTDGTYGECVNAFGVLLADYAELVTQAGFVNCQVDQGAASVRAVGFGIVDGSEIPLIADGQLTKNGGSKTCSVTLSTQTPECDGSLADCTINEYANLNLSGGDAASWNKFLKGQGCQDAMALE